MASPVRLTPLLVAILVTAALATQDPSGDVGMSAPRLRDRHPLCI